jgi:hypothetical protein
MENPIAGTINGLMNQTSNAIGGLERHGTELNINVVTAGGLTVELNLLKSAQTSCLFAQSELSTRRKIFKQLFIDARRLLTLARELLKPHLGTRHSVAWIETGLAKSLAMPTESDDLLGMLNGMAAYLLEHPEHENAQVNVLAERFMQLATALAAAEAAVHAQKSTYALALTTRNAKAKQIRHMLAALIKALRIPLDPMDDRYVAFGFNRPGQKATPAAPEKVEATVTEENAVTVKWPKTPRARYYRVWVRVIGADQELVPVGTPSDPDFTLERLPSNAEIEIAVSAVNDGGESTLSDVIFVKTTCQAPLMIMVPPPSGAPA